MSKPNIHFNDFVSLAVMLLMVVALISGQAGANAAPTANTTADDAARSPVSFSLDASDFEPRGFVGADSLKISVDIDTKLDHFRGEDE